MPDQPGLADLFGALAAVLRARGVRWYLFGAQAVAVYGVPRLTADVDATVDVPVEGAADLAEALADAGFVPRIDDLEAFVERTRVVPLAHVATGIPVDLVLAGPGLEMTFLDRARDIDLAGTTVPVICPEDLVTSKILAGRPKDLEDVRGILAQRVGELDLRLVRETLGLLEEALDRSDLIAELEKLAREPG